LLLSDRSFHMLRSLLLLGNFPNTDDILNMLKLLTLAAEGVDADFLELPC